MTFKIPSSHVVSASPASTRTTGPAADSMPPPFVRVEMRHAGTQTQTDLRGGYELPFNKRASSRTNAEDNFFTMNGVQPQEPTPSLLPKNQSTQMPGP